MPRELEIYQVDAFTDALFGGNPAGVVPCGSGLSAELMQKIAREMNLSETAFVFDARGNGSADFEVRFFTPQEEVDLCGHATIATFWLLAELGVVSPCTPRSATQPAPEEVRVTQKTRAGILPVDILFGCEGKPARVMMSQNLPTVVYSPPDPEIRWLETALGAPEGSLTGFEASRPQVVSTGLPDLIVPVTSREALLSMRPDMGALSGYCREKEIISVHCVSFETIEPGATVHCRDFAPAVGIQEEAATGTASGATGAYLVINGLVEMAGPVTRIVCEQGHTMKRPSIIHVEIGTVEVGTARKTVSSVRVGGSAAPVLKGRMFLP